MPDQELTVTNSEPLPDLTVTKSEPVSTDVLPLPSGMTFAVVNGVRVPISDEPETVGTFVKHVGQQIDPAAAIKTLATAAIHPIQTAKGLAGAQGDVGERAIQAYDRGDYAEALAHGLNWLLPVIGPALDKAGYELRAGKVAAPLGDVAGMGLALAGPAGLTRAAGAAYPLAAQAGATTQAAAASRLTPQEIASNQFAVEQGIPLDLATATGSRFVRGVQKVAGESLLGAPVAERATTAQAAALEQAGRGIAADVSPVAASPEQAGAGVRAAIAEQIGQLKGTAGEAYGKIREAQTENQVAVPRPLTPDEQAMADLLNSNATRFLGKAPTPDEWNELRRIRLEMESVPYERGKLVQEDYSRSDTHYVPRTAGAPVYHDILQNAPGTSTISRADVIKSLNDAIEKGRFTNAAKGALEVARQRLAGGNREISSPILPPGYGGVEPPTQLMGLPVDLAPVQQTLQPVFDALMQKKQFAGMLQGDEAEAAARIGAIVRGERFVPLMTADAALSGLKRIIRAAPLADLKTAGQGLAARAVSELDRAVTKTAADHGLLDALQEGRAATRAKWELGDLFESTRAEPVGAWKQLVRPRDEGIGLLRQVREAAPGELPKVARAWLEQALDLASERGRFDHADRLYSEWQKLGPQTKNILFSPQQKVQLDRFFLLAKRIAENPNPSGTAPTLVKTGEAVGLLTHPLATLPATLTMAGLARALYTPRGVAALNRLLSVSQAAARSGRAGAFQAARVASLAEVSNAARASLQVLPKAADQEPSAARQ